MVNILNQKLLKGAKANKAQLKKHQSFYAKDGENNPIPVDWAPGEDKQDAMSIQIEHSDSYQYVRITKQQAKDFFGL